jgi:hypothetical protein
MSLTDFIKDALTQDRLEDDVETILNGMNGRELLGHSENVKEVLIEAFRDDIEAEYVTTTLQVINRVDDRLKPFGYRLIQEHTAPADANDDQDAELAYVRLVDRTNPDGPYEFVKAIDADAFDNDYAGLYGLIERAETFFNQAQRLERLDTRLDALGVELKRDFRIGGVTVPLAIVKVITALDAYALVMGCDTVDSLENGITLLEDSRTTLTYAERMRKLDETAGALGVVVRTDHTAIDREYPFAVLARVCGTEAFVIGFDNLGAIEVWLAARLHERTSKAGVTFPGSPGEPVAQRTTL